MLSEIIGQLPIQCIILLRQVSKHICLVTHDRLTWAHAYCTSSVVLPEGPLICQTAQTLESILVCSTRLKLNWPPNSNTKAVRTRILPFQDSSAEVRLLCERWLLVTNGRTRVAATMPTQSGLEEKLWSTLYDVPTKDTSIVSFLCESINPSCTKPWPFYLQCQDEPAYRIMLAVVKGEGRVQLEQRGHATNKSNDSRPSTSIVMGDAMVRSYIREKDERAQHGGRRADM
ncbi:hypothetical protein BJ138DRAFT_1184275 [Hygrophoropsis aurantiaca]|uniref:Uncharacterized protein n=1 Tax=Hygrophoropsis aurantiaca TaxID=72124 RepID=A0ACB7ZS98_9AGAM|nr:hypothetical protein BJ138DRAFT_1184275 [Hygrophoropsis aurantiaca]